MKMKKLMDVGEFGFIKLISRLFLKKTGKPKIISGIGDDTAVIPFNRDNFLLLTTDMLLEDVHFKRSHPPYDIGHKALAVSISDIAAMGGIPRYALISVGLPKKLSLSFAKKIFEGIRRTARDYGIEVVGGDTNCSRKIVIASFVAGTVRKNNLVLRSRAKEGDYIFVTGTLGGAADKGKHLKFAPRLPEAQYLAGNFKLNSMIDISDGLLADLGHILSTSRAGALLWQDNIPLASKRENGIEKAYYAGEDFELLFTVPKRLAKKLLKSWPEKFKTKLSCIGQIKSGNFGLKAEDKNGVRKKLKAGGFRHF